LSKNVTSRIILFSSLYILIFVLIYFLYFQGIFSTFKKNRQEVILQNSACILLFFIGSVVIYFFLSKWISKTKKKYLYLLVAKSTIFIFIASFQSILSYSAFYVEMDRVENSEISSALSNELTIALQSPQFSELSDKKKTELLESIPSIKEEASNGTTIQDYYERNGWVVSLTSVVSIFVLTFSIFPAIDEYHEKNFSRKTNS